MMNINEMVNALQGLGFIGMTLEVVNNYTPKQIIKLEEFARHEVYRRKCAEAELHRMIQEFKETSK